MIRAPGRTLTGRPLAGLGSRDLRRQLELELENLNDDGACRGQSRCRAGPASHGVRPHVTACLVASMARAGGPGHWHGGSQCGARSVSVPA